MAQVVLGGIGGAVAGGLGRAVGAALGAGLDRAFVAGLQPARQRGPRLEGLKVQRRRRVRRWPVSSGGRG